MGGHQESGSSSQRPIPKTWEETQLQATQLEFARETLDAFRNQAAYQEMIRGATPEVYGQITGYEDPLTALSPEERALAVRQSFGGALAGARRADEISEMELERLRRGPVLTPEQEANIRASAEAELASGLSDIRRFAEGQREQIATELAPRLGLHRSDTPILDRSNRIAAEAVNAAGRLASDVRGREARARLEYPLAAGQAEQAGATAQQALGWSRADVLADLNQRAFQNRLALTGQVGQQGLGLATGYNVPAAQQSIKPTLGSESESSGFGWQWTGLNSSRALKEILGTPDGVEILERLKALPVAFWRYLAGDDKAEHVGTFAEDFQEAFGLGDGRTIDYRDLVGFLLIGLQVLGQRVDSLAAEGGG